MTKRNRSRFAAMLTTYPKLDIRAYPTSVFYCNPDQTADALRVEHLKRIVRKDTTIHVGRKKTSGVVTTQTICSLGQVVCSEREEFGASGDLIGGQGGSRELDHRSDHVAHGFSHYAQHLLGRAFQY